jgi:azurin
MKTSLRGIGLAVLLGVALLLAACGGGGNTSGGGDTGTAGGGAVTFDLTAPGESLAFEPTTLTASAGQEVTINFANGSAVQQHNWVLVNGGESVASQIAADGITAGPGANYLPADQANIIAATGLANGGETVSVSFTAPAAGTYQYICTVPGHYPLMQGTLTVQ